jgi:hypothetical protein
MLLLGLLSILQITLLPGILTLKAFKLQKNIIQTILFSFALSLIVNHLIVFGMTAIGIDISLAFYILFAIEIIAFLRLYAKPLNKTLREITTEQYKRVLDYLHSLIPSDAKEKNTLSTILVGSLTVVFIAMAAWSLWWAFKVWYTNVDTGFTQWDAVVSWNRWATEWFSGNFPTDSKRYAQLIPTNFAVSYAFLRGTEIQFFAKSLMPLFNFFILLMLFELGITQKRSGYFIAVVVARFVIKKFLGDYIVSGYVDVALAFFALVPFYTLLKAKTSQGGEQQNYLFLGAIFAAGAALTKQNGLFILATYPILAYLIVIHKLPQPERKEKLRTAATLALLGIVIISPWYIFNEYRIFTGANSTNVAYLAGARHEGRNLIDRFLRAVGMLEEYALLFPFILVLLPFLEPAFRWGMLLVVIPYAIIWALAFSTFPRNLSIALPLLSMMAGISAEKSIDFGKSLIDKLKIERIKLFVVVLSLVAIVLVGGLFVPNEVLIKRQTEQQKEILLDFVNQPIYNYFEKRGQAEPIITNYPIRYLPGLEEMQIEAGNFQDYDYYQWVKEQHPEARLMLIQRGQASEQVLAEVDEKLESGEYKLIFKKNNYMFIRFRE